jgi:Leucine-rich repeat (LRR) protein
MYTTLQMPNLRYLKLASNRLPALPIGMDTLTQLVSLDLSYNLIQFLDGLEGCKQLRSLKASHNRLRGLPRDVKWKRLVELDLSFNQIMVCSNVPSHLAGS